MHSVLNSLLVITFLTKFVDTVLNSLLSLSGLCVHLAGYHSGIVECECPQIKSLLASSVPSLQIYASMTRKHQ